MRILRVDDPRDPLDRAGRDQLYRFAIARGVKEIDEKIYNGANAAVFMRMILRQKGITDINVPHHQLGMAPQTAEQPSGKPAVTLEDTLKEELKQAQEKPSDPLSVPIPVVKSLKDMTYWQLRAECDKRGIPCQRTDKMAVLREKLLGQTAT